MPYLREGGRVIESLLLGLLLTAGPMVARTVPQFQLGEITRLRYAPDRQAVVIGREWSPERGYEYTIVPAELVFREKR